jgi:hypothetical protein
MTASQKPTTSQKKQQKNPKKYNQIFQNQKNQTENLRTFKFKLKKYKRSNFENR